MKKPSFTSWTLLAALGLFTRVAVAGPVPEVVTTNNYLPPLDGVYVTPAMWHAAYAAGIIIRDVRHRGFTENLPVPPLGASQTHNFGSTVDFQISRDGGATYTPASAPASVVVRVKHTADAAGKSYFDTEMLALNLTGGGVMLRESPTLPSRGRTTMRPIAGGFLTSSFFDIFTEVSTDGGTTWLPARQAAHVELRRDPRLVTPVGTPTTLLPPPNDVYVSPQQWHALFAQGIVIKDVKHKYFTPSQPPPAPGVRQVHQFNSRLDMQLSTDGGKVFRFVSVPALVQVAVENKGSSASGYYDTEMLALSLTPAAGVMIRESPTLPSRGGTEIEAQADGTYRIGSFFDIFPEVSTDGGQSWSPSTTGPVRVELRDPAPPQPAPTANLPTLTGEYISPQRWHALYANGIIVSNVTHRRFLQDFPPPPPGGTTTHSFNSTVDLDLVRPGQPPVHVDGVPAQVTVRMTSLTDSGNTRYFDTEMLQLDIWGSGLPPGVMVRESPSKASLGRTSLRQVPGGGFQVDSFFDITTEISVDNGQSWSPQANDSEPATMRLRTPTTPPLAVVCPGDLTVVATGPAGAVVTFTATASGGCGGPVTLTATPPSGSLFPVGTTTVTVVATDPCGNVRTCTFQVTVQPPIVAIPDYFFPQPVLPPPGVYISPALYHILYANGIIIRDVRHRRFTQNITPPPAGSSVVHSFGSQVSFELSTDNGNTFTPVSGSADVTVRVTHSQDSGGQSFFDTEMLALTMTSGAVMIRESPTLQSRGQTSVRSVPGGYMIGSFFDIFPELSLDGGHNWLPPSNSGHVELRPDPALVDPVPTPTQLLPPPNGTYVSPAQWHALYAQGIVIRDVRHKRFTQAQPPPPAGGSQVHTFDSVLDLQLSRDGGLTFQDVRAQGSVQVRVTNIGSSGQDRLYDTEMLALNLTGLPTGVMIRESPTLPSPGLTQISPQPDGTFQIDSFFDIFTELSVDGGATWDPTTNGPVRVQLVDQAREQPGGTTLPPDGEYITPQRWHALYQQGIIITNVTHRRFTQTVPPPPPGQTQTETFGSQLEMDVLLPGNPPFHVIMPANVAVQVTSRADLDTGNTRFFDTEMLMLSGESPGIMLRESPTLASLGRTSMRMVGLNQSRISSFFDVFTEVSLDGGQTWLPQVSGPGNVAVRRPPPFAPFQLLCPADITVTATGPSGAVVNYLVTTVFGDCPFGPYTVTCTPPSGSTFPVGTTVVTCVGNNGCGEHPTCSFKVMVKPKVQKRLFATPNLPPLNGKYVSPREWHALYANGIVISNASHRRFTQSFPPQPGTNIHTFGSQVSFQLIPPTGEALSISANASVAVRTVDKGMQGDTHVYETEMLQLNIQGGNLPPGMMIRESPTRASTGEVGIRQTSEGYRIGSFFDVFTEISTDGGQSWSPSPDPAQMELQVDTSLAPPTLANARLQGGNLMFSLPTQLGLSYLTEVKGSLEDPEWFSIIGALGDGLPATKTDFFSGGMNQGFYRERLEESLEEE